jgi:hypothetical protein
MALTPRFGLSAVGGTQGGTIVDDGQKYTLEDRYSIDRILGALEKHDHTKLPADTPVPNAPTAVLGRAGTLPAGKTYYYKVAFVDRDNLESAGGPEVSISTPAPVSEPGSPQLNSLEGGNLEPGVYYYTLTAIRGTEESTIGPPVSGTAILGEQQFQLFMPVPEQGVEKFRIWRMGDTDSGYSKIGLITATAGATFIDDGSIPSDPCACDPENAPPVINRGDAVYSITVTLSQADQARMIENRFRAWRLYRTDSPGNYSSTTLIQEVVDQQAEEDPTSPIRIDWVDDGSPAVDGRPRLTGQNLAIQPYAIATGTALPSPTRYPVGYPYMADRTLYVRTANGWRRPFTVEAGPLPDPAGYPAQTLWLTGTELYAKVGSTWAKLSGGSQVPGGTNTAVSHVRLQQQGSAQVHKVLGDTDTKAPALRAVAGTANGRFFLLEETDPSVAYELVVDSSASMVVVQTPIPTAGTVYRYGATFAPLLLPTVEPTTAISVRVNNGTLIYEEV